MEEIKRVWIEKKQVFLEEENYRPSVRRRLGTSHMTLDLIDTSSAEFLADDLSRCHLILAKGGDCG